LLSVLVVSGLRAYTYGPDRWSIGEHQAFEQLRQYAAAGDERRYQVFLPRPPRSRISPRPRS
jgi:hypothetical protein